MTESVKTFTFPVDQKFLVSDSVAVYATPACLLQPGDVIITNTEQFKVISLEVLSAEVNVKMQKLKLISTPP